MRNPQRKILSLEHAAMWWQRARTKAGMLDLVVTNGCFDVLHRGHVDLLCRARDRGDALIVLVNGDASVRALKGPGRPVNRELDRAYLVAALTAVDLVVVFDAPRCDRELRTLGPDVYVKAGDYTLETLDPGERAALEACGTAIEFVPLLQGYSTTAILERSA